MNLLIEGCSANPPAQNQPFPGYSSQFASMTPEQFQQHQQEQQQAFFRWQQSRVLNHEFQDLQQHPPSFNSETSQSLNQPQQVDSPKKGGRKKTKSKRGKNVEDEPVAAGRWLPVEEELLATCYVAVSEDNNVERSQKHETFWAFEAQAEKDRTLMRLEELRFLATSTKDLDDDDAYWIKKQK
uniref:Uncharacterized protein n=1 Tax=Tanacetum cinerariifolium TaxID=118510 RepID=A0A6L2JVY8_TANCI|nr:hypothetical protein [Tanacetum cinerariifolium]